MMRMFIGLMGVANDGRTLYTPSGRRLCRVPEWMAWRIQAIQHRIAAWTWSKGW